MRKIFGSLLIILFIACNNLYAEDVTTVEAKDTDISDNLDLEAVASIFGEAKDLEEFEKKLNDPDTQISNLDLNEDGYISAADLKRQFMEANPEIREMSEGFAHELYNQILKSGNSGPEELARMVESFFADFVEQSDENQDGYLTAPEFPGTVNEFKNIAWTLKHGINQEDLIDSFRNDNPDLVELRESLLGLKNMAKQNNEVQPRHIDMYV